MNTIILAKTYDEPCFCEKEILRYAGCKNADCDTLSLLHTCMKEVRDRLTYKLCYCELPVSIHNSCCDFGFFHMQSRNLAENLKGCQSVLLFAATVGIEIDRLISKYGRISPSKALMLQAIGAERIEALCDAFCNDIEKEKTAVLRPRFSPGYGDLPLTAQKDVFSILDCSKRIGLYLNDSLLMSPSKSVTAFAGISFQEAKTAVNKCGNCDKKDCSYRSIV